MKRLIALLVLAAVAAVPASASAKSKTKVYKGTFSLVGADGDYVTGKFGKVQLVDGKRNDKLSVHVRRLAARTTYVYRLQEGTCAEGAPGGTDVPGWSYRRLKTSRSGVGNSKARSRTFTARSSATYSVVVYAGDEVALCAQLRTKSAKSDKAKAKGKSDKPAKTETRGKSNDAPGQAEDKTRGKSDAAPGHAEDRIRGKSDDAPGQAEDKTRGKSGDKPRGKPRRR